MTNDKIQMTNEASERKFDLEDRTATFGELVITFARTIRLDAVSRSLISQLVRSATSVGANYVEANESDSRKEFIYRISICRREAKEARHWLRMVVAAVPSVRTPAAELWREADELCRIFGRIKHSTSANEGDSSSSHLSSEFCHLSLAS